MTRRPISRPRGQHSMGMVLSLAMLLAAIAVIIFVMAGAARSQEVRCAPLKQVQGEALKNFGEIPIGGGLITGDVVVEVLSAPDGTTFTIIAVNKDGTACLLASGFGWEPGRNPPKPGRPS